MKIPNVFCLFCKKEVYMPKNRLATFKYCSRDCKDKCSSIQIKAKCEICKTEFTHISSRCKKAKYCSRKCYYKSQTSLDRGTFEYMCITCGRKFMDSPSKNRQYCSPVCRNKKPRELYSMSFGSIRKKMFKSGMIDRCEKCGYGEVKEILGIHHIDENRINNKKENLMVVCPNCHSLIHRQHIPH